MFAQKTKVGIDKTKTEIEKTLARYGANSFAYVVEEQKAMIGFRIQRHVVRIVLPIPRIDDVGITHNAANQKLPRSVVESRHEQICRSRWRALHLIIKAKLEAVDAGISTIEREFLADVLLPGGKTVSQLLSPQIEMAYKTGDVKLLT